MTAVVSCIVTCYAEACVISNLDTSNLLLTSKSTQKMLCENGAKISRNVGSGVSERSQLESIVLSCELRSFLESQYTANRKGEQAQMLTTPQNIGCQRNVWGLPWHNMAWLTRRIGLSKD